MIFDAAGRLVDELLLASGSTVTWPETGRPPGVYFVKAISQTSVTKKVVLID
jgi:hypothetical protein